MSINKQFISCLPNCLRQLSKLPDFTVYICYNKENDPLDFLLNNFVPPKYL